jgi:hypothetical protein
MVTGVRVGLVIPADFRSLPVAGIYPTKPTEATSSVKRRNENGRRS